MTTTLNSRKPAGSKPTQNSPPSVEEEVPKYYVPNITIKDLHSAIPRFKGLIALNAALFAPSVTSLTYIPKINPQNVTLPHPALYKIARGAAWLLYDFCASLPAMGLWILGHECGHHAFSTSKTANNVVGWLVHSSLGAPYFSWKITHGRHHAQTSHLTQDQVYIPSTRSELGLPPLDPKRENLEGTKVSADLQELFSEALEDAPIVSIVRLAVSLFLGWPIYLIKGSTGPRSFPKFTNHFVPKKPLFAPHQRNAVLISNLGMFLWLASILYCIKVFGFLKVFRVYLLPYLWVNHWLVLITFLQHTDPAIPHYQASAFTFTRGALSTFDRELMGGPGIIGKITGWICATTTHGICETHVAHHVCSKIPHYHAWEARDAINKRLAQEGIYLQGNPATWSEAFRVIRECKFVEDEGEVRFYKNAQGKAARVPVFMGEGVSDSGVDMQ